MKPRRLRPHFPGGWLVAILAAITATPVLAETANFGQLTLLPGFDPAQGTISGSTGGSYSLSNIAKRDRHKNACIGFTDPNPDYIVNLEKDFPRLKFLVNTGGEDTTLLIKGPDNNTIRCGDDTGKSKDASIDDTNFKRGTYKVWVGTFNPEVKKNYTLTIKEN